MLGLAAGRGAVAATEGTVRAAGNALRAATPVFGNGLGIGDAVNSFRLGNLGACFFLSSANVTAFFFFNVFREFRCCRIVQQLTPFCLNGYETTTPRCDCRKIKKLYF